MYSALTLGSRRVTHPWAVITDLAGEAANIAWYGLRAWVEAGFKDVKRGGWGWQHCKMQDASRVERLWLAMAAAMVWTVSVGSQAEGQAHHPARRLSCLQRGRLLLLAALLNAAALPLGKLVPEAWPEVVTPPKRPPDPTKQRKREQRRAYKRRRKAAGRRQIAA